MTSNTTRQRTFYLVLLAIFLALVLLLQTLGSFIHIGPVSISLVLIPIVIGGMMLGPLGGTILGLAFGVITLVAGINGTDAFTHILFEAHPFLVVLICLGKGTLAGLGAALIYRVCCKKHRVLGTFLSAGAAPVINTGLFILGALFMQQTLADNFVADGSSVLYFLIIGCAGINFIAEFALNLILAPALYRVLSVVQQNVAATRKEELRR